MASNAAIMAKSIGGGASSVHDRVDGDFYPTPPDCTVALLRWAGGWPVREVWEPACGDGAISRVLEAAGLTVWSSDLHDRGYGRTGVDFLAVPVRHSVITNPPFAHAEAFIRLARGAGQPFAMLLKATFWNAAGRRALFFETGPLAVLPLTWRPNFVPERGRSPTMDVCWTVWAARPVASCACVPIPRPSKDEMARIADAGRGTA